MLALRPGVYPWPQGQLLALIPYVPMVHLIFWGEYPKGIPFLFLYKKRKRESDDWGCPRAGRFIKLSREALLKCYVIWFFP